MILPRSAGAMKRDHTIPSLDGLRALSILLVLGGHASLTANYPSSLARLSPYLLNAELGVRVFFVISGFLITTLLLREETKNGSFSLQNFYQRRILRIFPVYLLFIGVVAVWDLMTGLGIPNEKYLSALTFTTGATGNDIWLLGHTWSLSVEEQFYLLWPTLLLFLPARVRIGSTLLILLGLPVARTALFHAHQVKLLDVLGYSFFVQGDPIVYGCLFALIAHYKEDLFGSVVRCQPGLMRAAAVLVIYGMWLANLRYKIPHAVLITTTVQSIAIVYLVCSYSSVRAGWSYSMLNLPALRWIGVLSYSLYIWQQFFLYPHQNEFWWRCFPQNLLLVFTTAIASYYIIEKPFLTLKQRLAPKNETTEPDIKTVASRRSTVSWDR